MVGLRSGAKGVRAMYVDAPCAGAEEAGLSAADGVSGIKDVCGEVFERCTAAYTGDAGRAV